MLIFLFGKDTYRSREKLGEILKRYETLPKEKRNLQVLDCSQASIEDVQEELRTPSLFQKKKFLVFKNVFQNKDLADALFEQKEALPKNADTLLFFEEEGSTHPLFSFLKENAKSQEFKPLTRVSTLAWAEKEFQKYGKIVGKDALFLLIGETGNNLWRLSQEILKLAAFLGERTSVRKEDVKNLLHLNLKADIFSTIDAIARQENGKALELLSFHIKKGDEPLYILTMLAMQCRKILEAADIKQKELSLFEKVFETDKNIKTGRMKPASALYQFVAEV